MKKNLKEGFWVMAAAIIVGVLSGMPAQTVANAAGGTILLGVAAYPRRSWSGARATTSAAFRGARHLIRKTRNGTA